MTPIAVFRRGRPAASTSSDPDPDVLVAPLLGVPSVVPAPARAPAPPPKPSVPPAERPLFVVSSVIMLVALMTLSFVVTLGLIGPVRHARDQQTAFADLRSTLANATTPVTQTDESGRLHPLGTPLAVLDVPQIGLREVVLEGTTSGVLMSGAGHRRDTPMPGQAGTSVIMARQAAYGGPFRLLHTLQPGHVLAVTTGQGRQVFRVVAVRYAGDLQPPPVAAGKARLTLVTAAGRPWVPEGLVRVDADLVSPTQAAGPRPLGPLALPEPEKALSGDSSQFIWIILLGQALLIVALGIAWARYRWGRWQTWLAGGPVVLAIGVALSNQLARLLPNLM